MIQRALIVLFLSVDILIENYNLPDVMKRKLPRNLRLKEEFLAILGNSNLKDSDVCVLILHKKFDSPSNFVKTLTVVVFSVVLIELRPWDVPLCLVATSAGAGPARKPTPTKTRRKRSRPRRGLHTTLNEQGWTG